MDEARLHVRFRGLVYVLAGQRLCEADGRPSAPASPEDASCRISQRRVSRPICTVRGGFTKDCVPKLGGTVSRKPITGIGTGAPPPEKNIEEHLLEIRLCFEITSPALYPLQRLEKAKQSLVHRYVGTGN